MFTGANIFPSIYGFEQQTEIKKKTEYAKEKLRYSHKTICLKKIYSFNRNSKVFQIDFFCVWFVSVLAF